MDRRTVLAICTPIPVIGYAGCLQNGFGMNGDGNHTNEGEPSHERIIEFGFGAGGPLREGHNLDEGQEVRFSVETIAEEDDTAILNEEFFDDEETDVPSFVEETSFEEEGLLILQGIFRSTMYRFDVNSLTLEISDDVTGSIDIETLQGGDDMVYRETVFVRTEMIRDADTSVTVTIYESDEQTTVSA